MQLPEAQPIKRPYEVVIIVHPDTTLEEQKELFRKNKATIENYKGTIHSLETWGKRTLGNAIGKMRKAIYFHSMFESDPKAIMELERTMRINDRVLRYVHTRLDERQPISKHMENFKRGLQESLSREKEREAKIAARKAAFAAAKAADRGE